MCVCVCENNRTCKGKLSLWGGGGEKGVGKISEVASGDVMYMCTCTCTVDEKYLGLEV